MLQNFNEFISKYNVVGGSLLVIKNNETHHLTFGYQDIENNILTSMSSIYKVASISKIIVSLGIMLLVDKNVLSLDEDISKYLGFIVRNPKYKDIKITIRMLLTHTSSIIDNGSNEYIPKGYDGANSTDDFIKLYDILDENSINFGPTFSDNYPGSTFIYSNLGFGILACIIEKVTNMYFRDYIVKYLLDKLDIKSGFRTSDIKNKNDVCVHYYYINNKFVKNKGFLEFSNSEYPNYELGNNYRGVAGGLYISVSDLAKIMSLFLNKGKYKSQTIISEYLIEEMKKEQFSNILNEATYKQTGLSLIIMKEFSKEALYGHFGNAYGLRGFTLFNDSTLMILLFNGGKYLSNEEHMTILLKKCIEYLVKEINI